MKYNRHQASIQSKRELHKLIKGATFKMANRK